MEYAISDKMRDMKPSAIREIFKSLTDPSIIAFAAGNPAPESFPREKLAVLTGACPAKAAEDVRALFEKVISLCRAEEYRLLDRSAQSEGADL